MTHSPPNSIVDGYEKSAATPKPPTLGDAPRRRCSPFVIAHTCMGFGALLVVLSIIYGTVIPPVVTNTINNGVAVCEQGDIEKEDYVTPYADCDDCVPFYYDLTMLNVTNAQDFLENGAKLQLQEVGPYVYRRYKNKVDVKLEDDLVSYKQYTYHVFDKERSCAGCSDTDQVVSWDIAYLNVIAQSGSESGFLTKLVMGTPWGDKLSDDEVAAVVKESGKQMMRWVNALNSNQPAAWKKVYPTVGLFLVSGVSAIEDLDLSGFEYNGVFATRPVSDYALGTPSMLAGLGLGTTYLDECATGLNEKCASCQGDECFPIYAECNTCAKASAVMAINELTCGILEKKYAAVYGDEEAADFAQKTCDLCSTVGVCAAPLPGYAEDSGLDYSKKAPDAKKLGVFLQKTGCDDKSEMGEFVQYDGFRKTPYWAQLDERRNPTLAEINAFAVYGNCANKPDNTTCTEVVGADGESVVPGGVSISGFDDAVDTESLRLFLIQGLRDITMVNTGKVMDDVDGIKMTRFEPVDGILAAGTKGNDAYGAGYPVDGVQPLAFNSGFLAYVSYPMFLQGDASLLEAVEITMSNGKRATKDVMYDGKTLKQEYYDRYQTYVDIEAGTGKSMRANKRLMASYALSYSMYDPELPMSDVMWPKAQAEVIAPVYHGRESAIVGSNQIDSYNFIKGLLASLLPVLIAGIIVGLVLVGGGFFYRRRAQTQARRDALGDIF